jgi:FkbM family methyltransferase
MSFTNLRQTAWLAGQKVLGKAPDCPWQLVLQNHGHSQEHLKLYQQAAADVVRTTEDETLDIALFHTSERDFWIRRKGERKDGRELLAYLLSEHRWMAQMNPAEHVRPGDIVLDCGAHVGVFTHTALMRGAGKVVAIEPDPTNLECLRRNFPKEIRAGRVVIYPKAVWSKETVLNLSLGVGNSGENSAVLARGGSVEQVPATTLDRITRELNLARVDFIKMDIEGAEREALAGGAETLRTFRPRLMLDSYHLPDDMLVLPRVIRAARPDYQRRCGPCDSAPEDATRLVPHVSYYF